MDGYLKLVCELMKVTKPRSIIPSLNYKELSAAIEDSELTTIDSYWKVFDVFSKVTTVDSLTRILLWILGVEFPNKLYFSE
jgi:hypothetical protein